MTLVSHFYYLKIQESLNWKYHTIGFRRNVKYQFEKRIMTNEYQYDYKILIPKNHKNVNGYKPVYYVPWLLKNFPLMLFSRW